MNDLFPEAKSSMSPSHLLRLSDPSNRELPLASRMRPKTLEDFIGQEHLLGEGKLLRRIILADKVSSLIFYGPSGTGKTTLAFIIANHTKAQFRSINAVTSNLQELRSLLEEARRHFSSKDRSRTIVFIDEIHRFNKAQQDALMPDVESGVVILIGATTYNPSLSINGPLLSRSLVFEFRPLSDAEIVRAVQRALENKECGFGEIKVNIEKEALLHIARSASGDVRRALNALEAGVLSTKPGADHVIHFTNEVAQESCQKKIVYYDDLGDCHYDTASAFIKSMRGSDPDAALYWLAKMLYAGEDPRFIIRRILILASEDIGNADPQALVLAAAGLQAIEFVGMPEARIILSQLVAYMALAPKSNASYSAIEAATKDVREDSTKEVPDHLRDSSHSVSRKLGHGKGYQYPHSFQGAYVAQEYVPNVGQYYHPSLSGFEKELTERFREIISKREMGQRTS